MSFNSFGIIRSAAIAAALMAGFCSAADETTWTVDRKKIVSFGWEWGPLTAADYVKYADRIDATGLDGVGVYVQAKDSDGKRVSSAAVGNGDVLWTHEMVVDQIADFRKATAHKGLRESFVRALGSPKNRLDWADDAVWSRVAESMGTLAWLAKQGGFRGLIVDPEDYGKSKQFERRPGDEPWSVLAPLARRRGREIFARVFKEFPDAVVFTYWLYSWHIHHVYSDDPMISARSGGDLWSAFVNGILDVMPPEARLVDGNECAYENKAEDYEFMASAIAQHNAVDGLVAPENRTRYRAQVLPGFGLYLDSYTNNRTNSAGKANHYYFGPYNGSRLGSLERNLSAAIRASSGYVWLWGEKYSWIKYDPEQQMGWHVSREMWADRLPGLNSIIRACGNPKEFLAFDYPRLLKAGKLVNLAEGQDVLDMSREAVGVKHDPKDESTKGKGYFHIGDENAKPGTHYVVSIDGFGEGIDAIVYWQRRKDGGWWRWRLPGQGIALRDLPDGRRHGEAVISVPEGADCMMIQFRLHPDPGKECGFDKVFLGLIPTAGDSSLR